MSALHELPVLEPLPPIQMPSHPDSNSNSSPFIQSPAPSFAESYSTAYTSQVDNVDDQPSRLPPSSLAPPTSLRKSISVDSFSQFGRENTRSHRSYANASQESSRSPLASPVSPDADFRVPKPPRSSRNRGESVGSVAFENAIPTNLDSDVERYDPFNSGLIDRFRRPSLKTQDSSRYSIRGGDLPLPSRTHTTSVGSSTAHSTSPSLDRNSIPSIPSTSSLYSHPKRNIPHVPVNTGRARSGSLGITMNSTKKPTISTNYSSSIHRSSSSIGKKDIVLAVFGTTGCGKSTAIKKGFSGYALTEVPPSSSPSERFSYIRRRAVPNIDGTDQAIEVIEIEIHTTDDGLVEWPQGLQPIDGIMLCYDSSKKSSYQPIETLLKGYSAAVVPIMVLGCKADLEHEVRPADALEMLRRYDTGLIEVSTVREGGKDKMRKAFNFLLRTVVKNRGPNKTLDGRNPASPTTLSSGFPWEDSRSNTPTASPIIPQATFSAPVHLSALDTFSLDQLTTEHKSLSPLSPIPTTLVGDSAYDADVAKSDSDDPSRVNHSTDAVNHLPLLPTGNQSAPPKDTRPAKKERSTQFVDLDELLDKLLFLAVSGDDPTFATHFLLTYRRFATPRSVLLAMQKRMRQLDSPCGDPMFACFAQMRICHLLETWLHDFPHDFAVKGTAGALNALIKSIISKTHLLHYGSEFLPLLERLPGFVDRDAAWALKVEISDNDSEDYTPEEDEEDEATAAEEETQESYSTQRSRSDSAKGPAPRERKPSLPLGKALLSPHLGSSHSHEPSVKQQLKDLQKLAQDVLNTDSLEIAQELTRQHVALFLAIQPRDWLYFTFVSHKREGEPITAFNTVANHLADWVVSLILCHDRPRHRIRQIEKLVEIALKLRQMNNYSALRAFVAGINVAANDGTTMELFRSKYAESAKNLKSWDVLLQQIRAHRAYRLALRNSKGACIPALEVHIADLIKAHEGNPDNNAEHANKIHWGKFNMMGRFIAGTLQCQAQCHNSDEYNYPERPAIAELFVKRPVMSIEMQKSRLESPDDYDDAHPSTNPPEGTSGIRRLFLW